MRRSVEATSGLASLGISSGCLTRWYLIALPETRGHSPPCRASGGKLPSIRFNSPLLVSTPRHRLGCLLNDRNRSIDRFHLLSSLARPVLN
ncbi:hypothetical protein DFH28DRAFT_1130012 [Melampsora americana]|nr:hypothetical protein DFH28DRAFT_1130012 [Melampsora americana]